MLQDNLFAQMLKHSHFTGFEISILTSLQGTVGTFEMTAASFSTIAQSVNYFNRAEHKNSCSNYRKKDNLVFLHIHTRDKNDPSGMHTAGCLARGSRKMTSLPSSD